ncbi:WD40-repeat-containing domain protein [Syncephalis plumigaleata]|nr:WD40-repeat-containing domain protein [Syncephalis plumigaleata]
MNVARCDVSTAVSSPALTASPNNRSALSSPIASLRLLLRKGAHAQQISQRLEQEQDSQRGNPQLRGLGINKIFIHDNDSGRGIDVLPQIDFIGRLPPELALYLLSFTDEVTLRAASQVNRNWHRFADDNNLWRQIYYSNPCWQTQNMPVPQKQPLITSSDYEAYRNDEPVSVDAPTHYKQLYRIRKTLDDRWIRGDLKTQFLQGHTDSVYCAHSDKDGILTGSRDRMIRQWDLRSRECVRAVEVHSASVLCLRRYGDQLITGSSDCTACLWSLPTFTRVHQLVGHTSGVLDVGIEDDLIITCSKDTTVRVWDRVTARCKGVLKGHCGPVNAAQIKSGLIVSVSGDATIRVWDAKTLKCLRVISGHLRGLACVRFDGKHIVSGSNDHTIRVWDVLEGHTDLVRTVWFNDQWIVSGSYDLTVKVWNRRTGHLALDLIRGHKGWIFDVQFDCSKIISVGQDRNIVIWNFGYDLDLTHVC